jgi:hypothetical protein
MRDAAHPSDAAGFAREPARAWMVVATFVVTTAALALAAAGFVRLVDPYRHFGTGIFPVLSEDERAEKLRLFRNHAATGPIEGLVLGSSRAQKLAPDRLAARLNGRFFNFAISNAPVEDDLAGFEHRGTRCAR